MKARLKSKASAQLPPDYSERVVNGDHLVARTDVIEELASAIMNEGTLYQWARASSHHRELIGRAPVYVARLPMSSLELVVKHAWHGGILAPLTRDRFRGHTRAPIELANAVRLRGLGIPASELVGYSISKAAFGLKRVDVASRFIANTIDLGEALRGELRDEHVEGIVASVAELLSILATNRVVHRDLNVKNILLSGRIDGASSSRYLATIIDVDEVVFEQKLSPAIVSSRNASRLERSIRKMLRVSDAGAVGKLGTQLLAVCNV